MNFEAWVFCRQRGIPNPYRKRNKQFHGRHTVPPSLAGSADNRRGRAGSAAKQGRRKSQSDSLLERRNHFAVRTGGRLGREQNSRNVASLFCTERHGSRKRTTETGKRHAKAGNYATARQSGGSRPLRKAPE